MTTVLLLNPMGVDITPWMTNPYLGLGPILKGTIGRGNTVVTIPYTNEPGVDNQIEGVDLVEDWFVANYTPGVKVTGFAYSEGCGVLSRFLRLRAEALGILPADFDCIMIGNATRKWGGFAYQQDVFETVADVEGYPDDTPYSVTDLVRQYDTIGDFPTMPAIRDAVNGLSVAATPGFFVAALQAIWAVLTNPAALDVAENAISGAAIVHNNYRDITLTDTNIVWLQEGNVRYGWSPTNVLPNLDIWVYAPKYQQEQDQLQRPAIEAGYERPVTIPTPTYALLQEPPPKPQPPEGGGSGLTGGDIARVAAAAEALAEQKPADENDWFITVYDKLWKPAGAISEDLMELTGTDVWNDKGSATLKIKGSSEHWALFQSCETTMVGVTVETQGLRFAFYVDSFDMEYTEKGEKVGTAHLLGIYDILFYYTIFPLWWLPIQAQPFSHAVYIWALCSAIEAMVTEAATRIQGGIMGFINNALSLNPDMRAWIGQLLQSNGNIFTMLKTPLYVVRTNPFLDTSPLIARTVRMESCGTVIADVTKAYGVDCRVDLWLPGDEQPDQWANLDQPTYVFTAKDRSQIEGPTKTVLDSAIRQFVDLGGSFGTSMNSIIQQIPGMSGVFHAPALGVNYIPPWAILVAPEPGEKGSVVKCTITPHTPKGYVHIVGGRSPKWVGAPRETEGHRPTGLNLTQRSNERDVRLDDRLAVHSHRIYRHPLESARGLYEQHAAGLPARRAVRAPQRRRPVPPERRGGARHCQLALQHRDAVRLYHSVFR